MREGKGMGELGIREGSLEGPVEQAKDAAGCRGGEEDPGGEEGPGVQGMRPCRAGRSPGREGGSEGSGIRSRAGDAAQRDLNKFLQTEDNFMPRLNYVSTRHAKSLRFFFRFIPAWAYGLRAMSTQKGSNALLALVVYFSVICLHFVYSPLLGKPKRGYRLVFSCVVRRRVITPTWFRASYKTGSSGRVCTRF
ncbi:uncharacterized protein LJ206_003112 isoform 1-T1 [Theristicus caerulescens]